MSQAERICTFIETFLTLGHSYRGQPFELMDWQKEVISDIYLTDDDGKRQRRTYVLGLPRKNGKSELAAALAIYHLIADTADASPLVISAAGDRQQARIVFDEAKRMISSSTDLSAVCDVFRNEIRCSVSGGVYRAVSADAGLQHGLNPSFVVVDELHVFKNSDLLEALTLGSATRSEPLTLVISTAGFDLESPLGRLYRHGLRIKGHRLNGNARAGEIDDPSFGMTWFGPAPGESFDASDPDVWQSFNPLWPVLSQDEFASAYATTHESAFIRYRLNGWTAAETSWLPSGSWDNLAGGEPISDTEPIVIGFDGAWKNDSTALVMCSTERPHLQVLEAWEAPEGDRAWRTPVAEVEDTIRNACERYTVREIAADPYRWEQTLQQLSDDGLPVIEYNTASLARMVPATRRMYDAILDGTLTHDGDPRLARHMANCVLKEDARGARITKASAASPQKIDLAVAAVVALERASFWAGEDEAAEPEMILI